jgi:HK97 family phage major capsid protein
MADISGLMWRHSSKRRTPTIFFSWAANTSAVLKAFPTRNLGTKVTHEPVLATKPHAKWVQESSTSTAGQKPTGKVTWADKTLVAEELAVIVPVHENVIADATSDVLMEITKVGGEAIAFALDSAVIFGHNKPATWTSNALLPSAVAAGGANHQIIGTSGTVDDLAGKVLQAAGALADKYDPTTLLSRKGLRYRFANLRATTGEPIFMASMSTDPMSWTASTGWTCTTRPAPSPTTPPAMCWCGTPPSVRPWLWTVHVW